jgi:riboflavin synthase
MFTGIIERTIKVLEATDSANLRRLTLESPWTDLRPGESIAINGCCLTVSRIEKDTLSFDVIRETLDKTSLATLKPADLVNVERSLKIGDRLDGHYVQGHIDGRATLLESRAIGNDHRLQIEAPPELAEFLIPKGSVAIDGISLTLASVRGNIFEVALIPTTLALTTLGSRQPGWQFNLETDIISKTVISWLTRQAAGE